jgi:hypothetical protein
MEKANAPATSRIFFFIFIIEKAFDEILRISWAGLAPP